MASEEENSSGKRGKSRIAGIDSSPSGTTSSLSLAQNIPYVKISLVSYFSMEFENKGLEK